MAKILSLVQLISSLSKAERKKISSVMDIQNNESDYACLYKIIEKDPYADPEDIKFNFRSQRPKAAFNTAINYLFDSLLTVLSGLRIKHDSFFTMNYLLMHAKVLFEKSIYTECFQVLEKIQQMALRYEEFNMLLHAQKMELDFLLMLNFPDCSEQKLLFKQQSLTDTLNKVRKIYQHASLYELLKFRILNKVTARSKKHIEDLNDLVVSEMSIVAGSSFENFEIKKNHKLFQSYYLNYVGDYNSAIFSFYELNILFEENRHLFTNPPVYYLMTIEGVLETLRRLKNYEDMASFVEKLKNLDSTFVHFNLQVKCVVFLYSVFPFIDTGQFSKAREVLNQYEHELHGRMNQLFLDRQIQLFLYTSIVYFGLSDYANAKKIINKVVIAKKNVFSVSMVRTIRLINLMIRYELEEFDYIEPEIRSIRREIQNSKHNYRTEKMVLKVIQKSYDNLSSTARQEEWEKAVLKIESLKNDKFEMQLINTFDFTAWVEAKIKNVPLGKILQEKHATPSILSQSFYQ